MGFVFLNLILYNIFHAKEGCLDMESITLDSFIEKRIKENEELFTKEELQWIRENEKGTCKIYLLGAVNSKECYEDKTFKQED